MNSLQTLSLRVRTMNCPSQLILICITLNYPDPTALPDQGWVVNNLFHLQKYVTYHSQLPSPFFCSLGDTTLSDTVWWHRVSTTDNVDLLVIIATRRLCSDSRSINQFNVTLITAVCHVGLNGLSRISHRKFNVQVPNAHSLEINSKFVSKKFLFFS